MTREKVVAHKEVGVRDGNSLARCLSTQELAYERDRMTKEQRYEDRAPPKFTLPTTVFDASKAVTHTRTQHTTTGRALAEVARAYRRGDVTYDPVSRRGKMAPGIIQREARPRPATPDAPSPRFLTDEGVPRKPYTMRRHEYIYTISADDVNASKGRLDDILDERRALEARLSSLQATKEEDDRALPRYYLETYRPPVSARPVCGERKGKIFTH